MVTRNFLNVLAMALQSGSGIGALPVRAVNGNIRYIGGAFAFPYSPVQSVTLTETNAGISVGTGNTPATEDDWKLASHLGSGISLTITATRYGGETPGAPYIEYDVTVTNTGSEPITVKEICYKQKVKTVKFQGATGQSAEDYVCLMDRTVLDTPVTIAAGDAGIITYKLRTIPRSYGTVGGVQMVSFHDGTDEQLAALLDAAIAGDADLQADAGWRVGDMRKISLGAFTGGNSVSCPAQDAFIVISSFEEYNGCGNILQFDFANSLSAAFRMNSSNTTTGGYGATEMYTTTLPAMVEALPSWLKTRLKTFSVLASAGGSSISTIETVTGNKLALRAAEEVAGSTTWATPGEGVQADYYTGSENRNKPLGIQSSVSKWWERSASLKVSGRFCCGGTDGYTADDDASKTQGLSPFGCV